MIASKKVVSNITKWNQVKDELGGNEAASTSTDMKATAPTSTVRHLDRDCSL